MPSLTYALTRDNDVAIIEIEYTVSPLIPASGPSWNDPGSPAEGGEIETLEAFLEGVPISLTDDDTAEVEAKIYDTHDYSDDVYDDEGWY